MVKSITGAFFKFGGKFYEGARDLAGRGAEDGKDIAGLAAGGPVWGAIKEVLEFTTNMRQSDSFAARITKSVFKKFFTKKTEETLKKKDKTGPIRDANGRFIKKSEKIRTKLAKQDTKREKKESKTLERIRKAVEKRGGVGVVDAGGGGGIFDSIVDFLRIRSGAKGIFGGAGKLFKGLLGLGGGGAAAAAGGGFLGKIGKVFKGGGSLFKGAAGVGKSAIGGLSKGAGGLVKGLKGAGGTVFKGAAAAAGGGGILAKLTGGLAKGSGKFLAKGAGKSLLKKVPILGLLAGGGFAIDRLMDGDGLGALGELASGAASIFAGPGTAMSLGIDAALMARDIKKMNQSTDGEVQSSDATLTKRKDTATAAKTSAGTATTSHSVKPKKLPPVKAISAKSNKTAVPDSRVISIPKTVHQQAPSSLSGGQPFTIKNERNRERESSYHIPTEFDDTVLTLMAHDRL